MEREQPIFHLTTAEEWHGARLAGFYTGSTVGRSLEEEGFVHCSFADQVARVARAYYRDRDDVVLLRIDPSLVDADVRLECPDPDRAPEDVFPHVYGPVPLEAVVRADAVPLGPDGHLVIGDLLDP